MSGVREAHADEPRRRYHLYREGRYPMPNDEDESDRETLKHIMMKELIGGKLHLCPLSENPQKICDLGTGFGDWAMESKKRQSLGPCIQNQRPQLMF